MDRHDKCSTNKGFYLYQYLLFFLSKKKRGTFNNIDKHDLYHVFYIQAIY
jgi:hypothetical protein